MPLRPVPLWAWTENAEIPKLLLEELNKIKSKDDIKELKLIRHGRGKYKIEDGTLVPINENNEGIDYWQYPPDSGGECIESFWIYTHSFEVYIESQLERSHQPHYGDISRRRKAMCWRFTAKGMEDNLSKKVIDSKRHMSKRISILVKIMQKGHYPGSKKYDSRENDYMKAKNDYEMNLKKKNQFNAVITKKHWEEEWTPWSARWLSEDDIDEFPSIVEEFIQKLCPHHVEFLAWIMY